MSDCCLICSPNFRECSSLLKNPPYLFLKPLSRGQKEVRGSDMKPRKVLSYQPISPKTEDTKPLARCFSTYRLELQAASQWR